MLAEEGVLCSELRKNDAKDVESCMKSKDVVRNMNPSLKVGDAIIKTNNPNQPKGCFMKENNLYFNSASEDSPKDGMRQICEGIFCILSCILTNLNFSQSFIVFFLFSFLLTQFQILKDQDAMVTQKQNGTAVTQLPHVVVVKEIVTLTMIVLET